jgi:hypothetical protein
LPTDPLHLQREELEAARVEIANALERANKALNPASTRATTKSDVNSGTK